MEEVIIRETKVEDIADIIRVANQAFLEDARRPSVTGRSVVNGLRSFPKLQLVAEVNGEIAGFIVGNISGDRGKVALLAVSPKYWRKGVGTKLIMELERRIKEMGGKEVTLGTPFARGFYEKVGYTCYEVEYKLIRELPYSVIPKMDSDLNPIRFEDLKKIVKTLGEKEALEFLRAFFSSFEIKGGKAYILSERDEVKGIVVVAENKWNSDLLEITYFYPSEGDGVFDLLENIVIEASKMGYRWVGLRTRNEKLAKELMNRGWKEAHMPEFWTMYLMRKELK
ncbi:MAG: hypothetical protein DRZ82_08885 [Thermoprotei archaeon]|nr:MAG: hypothetical protein DRZ82_08885 [Thermoprotei archaeon]